MDKDSSVPPGFLAEFQVTAGQAAGRGWIQVSESPDALDEIKNAIGDADKIGLLPKQQTSFWHKKMQGSFWYNFTSWIFRKSKNEYQINQKAILHSPEVKITIKRSAYNIQVLCEQSLVQDPMRLKSNSPCSLKDKAGPQWYQNVSNIIKDHQRSSRIWFEDVSSILNQSRQQVIKKSSNQTKRFKFKHVKNKPNNTWKR